jgi:AAA domain
MNPPPPRKMTAPPINQRPNIPSFKVITGVTRKTFKCGIYGPEGIGKSELMSLCPGATFADIELSMEDFNVRKVQGVSNWTDLRNWVASLENCIAGLDSVTRAEDWAAQYVIANKTSNEGVKAKDSLEDFKYKAGLRFVNDEFKKLLGDIDQATRRGVSFIMTAHNRVKVIKDPESSDFIRHEPNLVDTLEVSNMRSWIQFLDVCAFIDLDKNVEKRKATSAGTRSIYLDTSASHVSKARGIDNSTIDYKQGSRELWERLGVVK